MHSAALLLGLVCAAGGAFAGAESYGPPLPPEAGAPAEAAPIDGAVDPTAERLLGDGPPADAPPAPGAELPLGGVQLAVAMLLVGALAVAWGLRGRSLAGGGGPALRVGARVPLGPGAHLAVVEVQDGARQRRMLIGYGGGSPSLVAELADGAEPASARGFQDVLRAARRAAPSATPPAAAPPRRGAEPPQLARRSDLIAEVLAERGPEPRAPAERPAADRPAPERPPVATAAGDPEDAGPPAETYTFRGLIG